MENKMNILSDFNHFDKWECMERLFEDKLGHKLYRPIGMEWHDKGYYTFAVETLNMYNKPTLFCKEPKLLTFKEFLDMDIDIIIATTYYHEKPFYELIKKYKPKAKLVRQIGNFDETIDLSICKNVECNSLRVWNTKLKENKDIHKILCHQFIDLDRFTYEEPKVFNRIISLLNNYKTISPNDYDTWFKYKEVLKEFKFDMYGAGSELGALGELSYQIKNTSFVWHLKALGDGFGHVLHDCYACGRPMIVKSSYYKGQFGELLFIDGENCIDLDKHSMEESIKIIRESARPENLIRMCNNAYNRFKEVVDYDKELEELKIFYNNLK